MNSELDKIDISRLNFFKSEKNELKEEVRNIILNKLEKDNVILKNYNIKLETENEILINNNNVLNKDNEFLKKQIKKLNNFLNNNINNNGYIYILQTKELQNLNKPIYKIGATNHLNLFKQIKKYIIKCIIEVSNTNVIEQKLIIKFKQKFKSSTNIGDNYFEGDILEMKKELYILCQYN